MDILPSADVPEPQGTSKFRQIFSYLTAAQKSWIGFKVLIGVVWPIISVFAPSILVEDAVSLWFIAIYSFITLLGGLTSITGLVMFTQPTMPLRSAKIHTIGITVEFIGLCFLSVGPLSYLGSLFGAFFTEQVPWNWPLLVFVLAMVAAIFARVVVVLSLVRKEAQKTIPEKESL